VALLACVSAKCAGVWEWIGDCGARFDNVPGSIVVHSPILAERYGRKALRPPPAPLSCSEIPPARTRASHDRRHSRTTSTGLRATQTDDSKKHTVITGQECRRSLYERRDECHGVRRINALRELRRSADPEQRELAALLSVPLETLRTWDSGRRPVPIAVMHRAAEAVEKHARRQQSRSINSPSSSASTLGHSMPPHEQADLKRTSVCGPRSGDQSAQPRARGRRATSHDTTGGFPARRFVRSPCRLCRTTTINACND